MRYFNLSTAELKAIAAHFEVAEEELLQKSVSEILSMSDQMKEDKARDASRRNAEDEEYARIVKKFLSMYPFLSKYWTDEEIILACSKHAPVRSLVEERAVPVDDWRGGDPKESDLHGTGEYIRTSAESVPSYTKQGERLMEDKCERCHVFRVKNQYQGLCHGAILLELLYRTYPELEQFGFKAYSYNIAPEKYEIYPKNNIYTPLRALLEGDIDAIVTRNIEYGKAYNHGEYSVESVKKRLASDEARQFFDVIRSLDKSRIRCEEEHIIEAEERE